MQRILGEVLPGMLLATVLTIPQLLSFQEWARLPNVPREMS